MFNGIPAADGQVSANPSPASAADLLLESRYDEIISQNNLIGSATSMAETRDNPCNCLGTTSTNKPLYAEANATGSGFPSGAKKVTLAMLVRLGGDFKPGQDPTDDAKRKTSYHGVVGDQSGHILGKQFGGSGAPINIIPQSKLENESTGAWYAADNLLKVAVANKPVCLLVIPIYGDPTHPNRPNFLLRMEWGGGVRLGLPEIFRNPL